MIVIGVDIGMTGALAAIDRRGTYSLRDLPVIGEPGDRRVQGRQLLDMLREFVRIGDAGLVVFEDVRVRAMGSRQMAHSTEGALVKARGVVEAACDIAGLRFEKVQPQTWKRHYGLNGKDKADAREIATRLHPAAASELKRVKDHNRAEALLIARYGLERLA